MARFARAEFVRTLLGEALGASDLIPAISDRDVLSPSSVCIPVLSPFDHEGEGVFVHSHSFANHLPSISTSPLSGTPSMMNSKAASALILGLMTTLMSGCGGADIPELGDVSGKVTINGQPVVGIYVMATPKEGRPAYGTTGDDGSFRLMYVADVTGTRLGSTKISLTWPQGVAGPPVPAEYASMELDVLAGKNPLNIEMTSDTKEWKAYKPGGTTTID